MGEIAPYQAEYVTKIYAVKINIPTNKVISKKCVGGFVYTPRSFCLSYTSTSTSSQSRRVIAAAV